MTNIIVMTEDYRTNKKWFLYNHKYTYSSSLMMEVDCDDCAHDWKHKMVLHYLVILEDIIYYIPEMACVANVPENKLPADEHQHTQKYYDKEAHKDGTEDEDGRTDFVDAAKQLLDIDIKPKERMDQSDHNGEYMLAKIKERYPNE